MIIMGNAETGWYDVCAVSELAPGTARVLHVDPPVAVFLVDDEYFATDDTCTHAQSSLADGFIEGQTVECEFHFAKFCLRTGAALTPPAVVPLAIYPVEVSNGMVRVDLSGRAASTRLA
ncbi:bifunctional 3-phenylpropionate/cinnamic acid dioxygenase ferredoxin subunit [Mycolicibacterium sp. D5.8-2]|nr:bifunctional 3-phenylpropionate/cinnamic acid dioxygenase ferredoxin subunit [Mycolicibacterium sp. D5.8-2]MDW5615145.1 bifunctional 3-phenylpropionate/cinnamic acid dioxygenase ferredoxin subunit [Mycolicibacterium sp. D5.8-2]